MVGLMNKEAHRALFDRMSAKDISLKLLTFGLNEENILIRNFGFIDEKTVIANFDNNKAKWDTRGVLGERIYPPDRVADFIGRSDAKLIIMSAHIGEIAMQLDSLGVKEYYSALFLRPANYESVAAYCGKMIEGHAEEIEKVWSLLSDDKSREVFEGILRARQLADQELCLEISGKLYTPNMYFPDDVPDFSLGKGESFVDAGAFTGDTIEKFLKKADGQYSGIFAFEPDPSNYTALMKFCEGRENIRVFHSGLFSRKDVLCFQMSKEFKETPRIIEGNKPPVHGSEDHVTEVTVEALDNIPDIKPTLIKMDIEGSEMEALRGAASTIKNNMPKLAVCLYHKITDFWEIPLFLHEVAPEYKFYVRHHIISPCLIDTVLYATA